MGSTPMHSTKFIKEENIMAKVYFDATGKQINIGDLIMFPSAASCKGSRPDMIFAEVKGFNRGGIQVFEPKYSFSDTYGTSIRASSTPVRVVSKEFKYFWEKGDIFSFPNVSNDMVS